MGGIGLGNSTAPVRYGWGGRQAWWAHCDSGSTQLHHFHKLTEDGSVPLLHLLGGYDTRI